MKANKESIKGSLRLLKLVLMFYRASRQPVRASEWARISGCCQRTAYRDIVALQEAGFPLYSDARGWHAACGMLPARLLNLLANL